MRVFVLLFCFMSIAVLITYMPGTEPLTGDISGPPEPALTNEPVPHEALEAVAPPDATMTIPLSYPLPIGTQVTLPAYPGPSVEARCVEALAPNELPYVTIWDARDEEWCWIARQPLGNEWFYKLKYPEAWTVSLLPGNNVSFREERPAGSHREVQILQTYTALTLDEADQITFRTTSHPSAKPLVSPDESHTSKAIKQIDGKEVLELVTTLNDRIIYRYFYLQPGDGERPLYIFITSVPAPEVEGGEHKSFLTTVERMVATLESALKPLNEPPPPKFSEIEDPILIELEPGIATTYTYTSTEGLPIHFTFPADIVTDATTLQLIPWYQSLPDPRFVYYGPGFYLLPLDGQGNLIQAFHFTSNFTVTIHYSDDYQQAGVTESQLNVYRVTSSGSVAGKVCDPLSNPVKDEARNFIRVTLCSPVEVGIFAKE